MRNDLDLPKYEPQGRDGSYQWNKRESEKDTKELDRKFRQALENAKRTLKTRPVSLTEAKGNLYLQFSTQTQYDGSKGASIRSKYSVAQYLGISKCASTPDAVNSALEVALKVAKELESGTFDWGNYVCWIKGELPEHLKLQITKQKTCRELIEEFKAHYWATHDFSTEEKAHRSERGWRKQYGSKYNKLPLDKPLNLSAIKQVLALYNPSKTSYTRTLINLKTLCKYHSIDIDFKQLEYTGEIATREGRELSNEEIIKGWKEIKYYQLSRGKKSKYQDLYAWIYGMMATYGLRNHEVLNIQNLTQPFKLPNADIILPAFSDPNNTDKVIYTYGKTGKRVQPFPNPIEWIEMFNLKNVPDFPVFESLRQKDDFLSNFTGWCTGARGARTVRKIDFVPYDLRHSYAMRCRRDGINPLDAKDYMGHSLEMHERIYNKGIKASSLIESAGKYQQKIQDKPKLSEVEQLKLKMKELETENKELKSENQRLLQIIEAYKATTNNA